MSHPINTELEEMYIEHFEELDPAERLEIALSGTSYAIWPYARQSIDTLQAFWINEFREMGKQS
jgi:hypothetical protein